MHDLKGLILAVCLALAPGFALAADHSGDEHWIQDARSGCWIYNPYPESGESAAWEGQSCPYGEEANGVGTVTWFKYNAWTIAERGEMRDGLMNGEWIRRAASGESEHAFYVDGVRQQQEDADTDQGGDSSGGDSGAYAPDPGNDYLETLKRQNRENCERAAQGANIVCTPE
jgi:hypothetical protein